MDDPMNSTMPKCDYCGNYHSYSAEMCRDTAMKREGIVVSESDYRFLTLSIERAIRSDERRRIREGAAERVMGKLRNHFIMIKPDLAARIVDAVIGKE